MTTKDEQPEQALISTSSEQALRKRAEEKAWSLETQDLKTMLPEEIRQVLHELKVYQIQLEMQNEELIRAQVELGASRERYFDLYDLAPVGYITLSEQGLILEANLTAATLLGVARGAKATQPIFSRSILNEDQSIHYQHRKQLFETGEPQAYELRMVKKDGTLFWAHLESTVSRDTAGAPICRTVLSDITEHKRMEVELLRSRKLESLGLLAGGIAHDFNNLMMVVLGNVELALMELPADHDACRLLKTALKSVEQTKDLTNRFITFSRGGFSVKHIRDISDMLRETSLKAVRGTTVQVIFDIREELRPIEVDETLIRQVFRNITVNATEAMPDGGMLTIAAENTEVDNTNGLPLRHGSYVRIVFADNGTGIAEKDLSNVFDPYFTTKDMGSSRGLGLGLAVCHSVVKKHDGYIAVRSQRGEGATFTLYLPAPVEKGQETVQPLPASHYRILVMENEMNVRKLEKAFLEQLGHEVTEAKEGQDAIDLYKDALVSQHPFDLVILDLTVRDGLGGQLTMRELLKENPSVRAIITSGCVDDPVIEHYRDYGFRGALKRPFRFQEFGEMVKTVMVAKA